MAAFVEDLLKSFPDWAVYLAVFLLPFAEAAILLGFVIPGETALVFGGVLASRGQVNLTTVLILAVVGAITGDAVGYTVGRKYGSRLQSTALGQKVGDERWRMAEEFLHRRGGTAVFWGRWTALLRAMVPGAAGMAGISYRTFFMWNILGGTLWAVACVYGGYAFQEVIGSYISNFGYVLIALVALFVVFHFVKKRRERDKDELVTSDRSES
jgi:membrane-associated protein